MSRERRALGQTAFKLLNHGDRQETGKHDPAAWPVQAASRFRPAVLNHRSQGMGLFRSIIECHGNAVNSWLCRRPQVRGCDTLACNA